MYVFFSYKRSITNNQLTEAKIMTEWHYSFFIIYFQGHCQGCLVQFNLLSFLVCVVFFHSHILLDACN